MWRALRSVRIVIAVALGIIVGLCITAAVGLIMVKALNLISVAFAVMFIGIAAASAAFVVAKLFSLLF